MARSARQNQDAFSEFYAVAEQNAEQIRQSVDRLMSATQHALSTFADKTIAAQEAARELQRKALEFAGRNVDASFDFVRQLMHAEGPDQLVRLQTDFARSHVDALASQVRELAQQAGKAAGTASGSHG